MKQVYGRSIEKFRSSRLYEKHDYNEIRKGKEKKNVWKRHISKELKVRKGEENKKLWKRQVDNK